MTTVSPGFQTGRKSRLYYNSGTRASPNLDEINYVSKENFNPGDQDFATVKARGLGRDLQEEDSCKPASLTFSRLVPKGVTDTVGAALLASYGYGGTVYEFWVMDDDATYTDSKGFKFWGKVSKMSDPRDMGQFVERAYEVQEVVHFNPSGELEQLVAAVGTGGSSPTTTTPSPTTTTPA